MDFSTLSVQLQSILSQESFVFPGNLGGLLDRAVDLYPGRAGIIEPDSMLTFKEYYDRAIESASDPEAESILRRQREGVEFGEDVLQNISPLRKAK